jgi:hypothetical protein
MQLAQELRPELANGNPHYMLNKITLSHLREEVATNRAQMVHQTKSFVSAAQSAGAFMNSKSAHGIQFQFQMNMVLKSVIKYEL